ncbi:hypothetical protein DFJ63DRAFT_315426 [Scheffersomyces coipomensis]|uniref:uncharacterized protein n=1 Tax=Scheffersomyces coipomensis TaxID=1788519 RepID=UPI00315DF5CF
MNSPYVILRRNDNSASSTPTTTEITTTTSTTSYNPSSSASSSGNPNSNNPNYNSFVGNTPSTVLFFLALAVGVFIALLFVFFTIRYFIRSKYGLHVYPLTRRQLLMGSFLPPPPPNNPGAMTATIEPRSGSRSPTTGDATDTTPSDPLTAADNLIREQLELIRQNYGFDHYVVEEIGRNRRRMIASSRGGMRMAGGRNAFGPSFIGRRTGRRGRYSRMKKLTEEQCEILFPKKSYHEWLNGGKEDDAENRAGNLKEQLKLEEDDEEETRAAQTVVTDESDDSNSLHTANTATPPPAPPQPLHESAPNNSESIEMKEISVNHNENEITPQQEDNTGTPTEEGSSSKITGVDDVHYDSGSCAICLEVLEDEDVVRGLICGHVYHAECVDPWLIKRRACCPMCKRDYLFKRDSQAIINAQNGTTTEGTNEEDIDEEDEESGVDEVVSIDLEEFRNDPELRAILHELIPIAERVSIILSEESLSHLNLSERATEIAKIKYGNIFKMLIWRLMGISKKDLYNWAVVDLYRQYRREQNAATLAEAEAAEGATATEGETQDGDVEANAEGETNEPAEQTDANDTPVLTPPEADITDLRITNSVSPTNVGEPQISPETTRDVVEQRV